MARRLEDSPVVVKVMLMAGIDGLWYPVMFVEEVTGLGKIMGTVVLHKKGSESRPKAREGCLKLAERMGVPFED